MNINNSRKSAGLRATVIALAFAVAFSVTPLAHAQGSVYFFRTGVTDSSYTGTDYNQPTAVTGSQWYVGLASTTYNFLFTFANNLASAQVTVQGLPTVYSFLNFGINTSIGSDPVHDITLLTSCAVVNGDSITINNISINSVPQGASLTADQSSPSSQMLLVSETQMTTLGFDLTWQTLANANSGISPDFSDLAFTMIAYPSTPTATPEPATTALLGVGFTALLFFRRRK